MIKVIIIDDEVPARAVIKTYLNEFEGIEIVAECSNGFEGLKAVSEYKPDLIFLDIKMPKISGFEMLELIEEPPQVIFSTAYDDQAIKAFEHNAVDYLLKPYSKERFISSVQKALNILDSQDADSALQKEFVSQALSRENSLERIVIKNGSHIEIIPLLEIKYIEANDDYVNVFSARGKFLKQGTMKMMASRLPEMEFSRVHRSYIVRLDQIRIIEPWSKDSFMAILKSGEKVPVSKNGYQVLKEKLQI